MSLVKTVTFKGIPIPDAVHVIDEINIYGEEMTFVLVMMASAKSERLTGVTYVCPYDKNDSSPEEQAFRHLLTLPEFADANYLQD